MSEEEIAFAEIIGDLVEQWGFRRHLGRIWSLLFLSSDPVSASEIQDKLGMSAGGVSTALAELQVWGVIKRIRLAGDRNFYFTAEKQIWRSISTVLHTRELRILEEASGGLDRLEQTLKKSSVKNSEFQAARVKHVNQAVDIARLIMEQLAISNSMSFARLGKLFLKLKGL